QIGAHSVWVPQQDADSLNGENTLQLTGMVGTPDGGLILKEAMIGKDPVRLGEEVAWRLIERGAEQILAEVRG
ncbi:hydroxymethylbilane synthase, partial [Bacillus velezensis]